jgi:hypothetical protein
MDWGPEGPTSAAIDSAVSDRPVLLQDFSDHASTVNSKMLELMGVDGTHAAAGATPTIRHRDSSEARMASPDGSVREERWSRFADAMYDAIDWRPPEEVTSESLEGYTSFLSSRGVVALLDAMTTRSTLSSAATLDARGRLNLHFHGARVFSSLANLDASIADVRAWQAEFGGPHVTVDTLKLFLDGTNEFGTGAVLDPLITNEDDHGLLRMNEDDLTTAMQRLDAEGLDLHIHVVGDRGFRTALNAVERARETARRVADPGDARTRRADRPFGYAACRRPRRDPQLVAPLVGRHVRRGGRGAPGLGAFNRMYHFNPVITSGGTVTYGSDVVTQYEANRADPFFGMQIGTPVSTRSIRCNPDRNGRRNAGQGTMSPGCRWRTFCTATR